MTAAGRVHRVNVRTPEGVVFTFRIASPILRLYARIIDLAILGAFMMSVVGIVVSLVRVANRDVAEMLAILAYFVVSTGYDMTCERLWRGQTIGKRLIGLRVVDAQGLRLTFPQSVLRTIIRPVDALPLMYLVGGVASMLNSRGQRLGDLAGGTLVVWETQEPTPDLSLLKTEKYNSIRPQAALVARIRQAVNPGEARAAYDALRRREAMEPGARIRLFGALAQHFRGLTPFPDRDLEGLSDEQFVRNVVEVLYIARS